LGKFTTSLSKEFYQASCRIEGFLGQEDWFQGSDVLSLD